MAMLKKTYPGKVCGPPAGLQRALGTLPRGGAGLALLLSRGTTRSRGLARPCLAGPSTLHDTPSGAWRTNATPQAPPIAGVTQERRL